MKTQIIASLDGREQPKPGYVGVYWPSVDCTNLYDATGFNEEVFEPDNGEYPVFIYGKTDNDTK